MSFWQKVKALVSWKYLISGLVFIVLAVCLSFIDSADDVKVSFDTDSLTVTSKLYNMKISYDEIERAELTQIVDRGENIDGKDNLTLRTGKWKNDVWGEYHICADLDCTNCIVLHLTDGSTYVFSRLSNKETEALHAELLTHIS